VATEERRRRFQQEAQTASSLNHPHILTVFEAGEIDGQQYLVTEFIDGCTLREWARQTPPSLRQIVELLLGVADGLACAHQAGIIHRDIKPENILVAKAGYAKLVDFGLAKLLEPAAAPDAEARTLSAGPTLPGVILGTVAYMAPEQAAGRPVDARADIFAFGVVLYELLAGQRPFGGKSDIDVLHAILNSDPRALDAPSEIRSLVEKALEKDPADRFQSMREMVVDLKRLQRRKAELQPPVAPQPVPRRRRLWIPAAIAALALIATAAAWLAQRADVFWESPLADARFTRFTDFEGAETGAAISHDGKLVAFLSDREGQLDIWVSQVGSGEFVNLTKGRFRDMTGATRDLGFSADGAYVWMRIAHRGLQLLPTMGGAARPFLDRGVDVAWSPDGSRVAFHLGDGGDPIFVADRNGNNPKQIFVDQPGMHCHFPAWSPDGRFIYFVRGNLAVSGMDIWRVPSAGGAPERITHHNADAKFPALLDDRTLVYVSPGEEGSGPWLYVTDVERRRPRRVASGVEHYTSVAASGDGRRLVATVSNPSANLWSVPISERVAEEADARRVTLPTVRATSPRYGPDYFLYLSTRGGADGIWKFKDGAATEIWKGSEGAVRDSPAISPDGRLVTFAFRKQGRTALHVMTADGTNLRPVAESLDVQGSASWSPDGRSIVTGGSDGKGPGLFQVPVDGGAPVRLVNKAAFNPVCSGDGSIILYSDAVLGRFHDLKAVTPAGAPVELPGQLDPEFERWVAEAFSKRRRLLVRVDGERYRFLPGGKQVVLMQGQHRWQQFWLWDLETGRARKLTNLQSRFAMRGFDVSPDGKQILFDRTRENSDIVLIERK